MLFNINFRAILLQNQILAVPLHQVFHGIRFKVNKGWVKALTLFFIYTFRQHQLAPTFSTHYTLNQLSRIVTSRLLAKKLFPFIPPFCICHLSSVRAIVIVIAIAICHLSSVICKSHRHSHRHRHRHLSFVICHL